MHDVIQPVCFLDSIVFWFRLILLVVGDAFIAFSLARSNQEYILEYLQNSHKSNKTMLLLCDTCLRIPSSSRSAPRGNLSVQKQKSHRIGGCGIVQLLLKLRIISSLRKNNSLNSSFYSHLVVFAECLIFRLKIQP